MGGVPDLHECRIALLLVTHGFAVFSAGNNPALIAKAGPGIIYRFPDFLASCKIPADEDLGLFD